MAEGGATVKNGELVKEKNLFAELAKPFSPEAIRWRVGSTTKDKKKGMALAYIDARDVMNRLDQVVGPGNWQDDFSQGPHGIVFCRLSVLIRGPVSDAGEKLVEDRWIAKMDGAGQTDIESDKGAVSGALKRAAVKFGIGRYLYDIASPWVEIEQRGRSSTIKASEKQRLQDLLRGLGSAEEPTADETRLSRMIGWCESNHVTREMVFEFLGVTDLGNWSDLEDQHLDAISEQAKLVHDGMPPDEAFGRTSVERAEELTTRIAKSTAAKLDVKDFDGPAT